MARELGLETEVFYADEPADYVAAFAGMRTARSEALVIISAPDFFRDAALLSRLALEAGLPTVCEWASMARDGCLIGYGPNFAAISRRAADYVARILRGAMPGELPIEQPTVFEFAINLKTAKALGLTIPESACSAPTRCSNSIQPMSAPGVGGMSASLIGHSGSSTFRLSTTTAVSMSLTGSCFSSESAPRPFHYGIRERGGTIYCAALPSD